MTDQTQLPAQTRVAAYAVAVDDERRMLIVRVAPGYGDSGQWTLPGGGVNFGEHPEAAVRRELEEETGFTGEVAKLLSVGSWTRGPMPEQGWGPFHGIQIVYEVRITGGSIRHEVDESTDMAAWVAVDDIRGLPIVPLLAETLDFLEAADSAHSN